MKGAASERAACWLVASGQSSWSVWVNEYCCLIPLAHVSEGLQNARVNVVNVCLCTLTQNVCTFWCLSFPDKRACSDKLWSVIDPSLTSTDCHEPQLANQGLCEQAQIALTPRCQPPFHMH